MGQYAGADMERKLGPSFGSPGIMGGVRACRWVSGASLCPCGNLRMLVVFVCLSLVEYTVPLVLERGTVRVTFEVEL
jgi:hypothetical protein